jgi:hypothetical protein
MAKKAKTSSAMVVRAVPMRAPTPIIRVSAPRAAPVAKKKSHHKKSGGHSSKQRVIGAVVAGYALGFVDKQGTAIPTVPYLGRAGTIAAAAYFFGKGQGIWGEVMLAAAAIAGYEMGSTGKIAGGVVPQVSGGGVAAQV